MGSKSNVTKVEPRAIKRTATQDEYAHNMTLIYTGMLLARQGLIRDSMILGAKKRDEFLELLKQVEKGLGKERSPYALGNLPELKENEGLNCKYPSASLPLDVGAEVQGSYGWIASKFGVPLNKKDIVDIVKYFWDKEIDPGLPQKWHSRGKIKRVEGGKGQTGAKYDSQSVRDYLGELYGEPTSERVDMEPWTMKVAFPSQENPWAKFIDRLVDAGELKPVLDN